MSDQQPDAKPSWVERYPFKTIILSAEIEAALRRAVGEVMAVQDVTTPKEKAIMRFRGTLNVSAEEAFKRLRPQFEATGHTPHLRHEGDNDVIRALPIVYNDKQIRRSSPLAIGLLIATILSVFIMGVWQTVPLDVYIATKLGTDLSTLKVVCERTLAEFPQMIPTDAAVIAALPIGLLYALSLLGILGSHEMGHYIVARINKVFTTLPYFIPLPVLSPFGTMGAIIFMHEPAPNRKVQFDIGIAGPLVGFLVAIPILYLGLKASTVMTMAQALSSYPAELRPYMPTMSEGQSLFYLGMKYLIFGKILPLNGLDVWISPVAYAAWAGLLVTALNLMPAGQLDGGHVIYGLFGEKARKLYWPLIGFLSIMTFAGILKETGVLDLGFGWWGWGLWVLIIYYLMRDPAPVLDEITGLDQKRRWLGVLMLVIFVLIFTPIPLTQNIPACPVPPIIPPATPTAPIAMLIRGLLG